MNRAKHLLTLLIASVGALTWPATTALASVPLPDPPGQVPAAPLTTVVTHSTSGMAVWLVVLIAGASVAIGVALTETVRSIRHRIHGHRLATT
jgi:hypothetical protein